MISFYGTKFGFDNRLPYVHVIFRIDADKVLAFSAYSFPVGEWSKISFGVSRSKEFLIVCLFAFRLGFSRFDWNFKNHKPIKEQKL